MDTLSGFGLDDVTVVLTAEDGYDAESALDEAERHARCHRDVLLEIGRRRFLVRSAAPGHRRTCSSCGTPAGFTFGWPASTDALCSCCARGLVRGR